MAQKKKEIIGAAYEELKKIVKKHATKGDSVLFVGERGSGKERFAEYYHKHSTRKDKPFETLNCAQISETLLESELFGHKKGTFTGADSDKEGLLKTCNNGVLLLDELGDAVPSFRDKLMRVIVDGKYRRLGDAEPKTVNLVFIAATNKPDMIREDLVDRFDVVLSVPPLQKFDIPILARHFFGGREPNESDQYI